MKENTTSPRIDAQYQGVQLLWKNGKWENGRKMDVKPENAVRKKNHWPGPTGKMENFGLPDSSRFAG